MRLNKPLSRKSFKAISIFDGVNQLVPWSIQYFIIRIYSNTSR